MVNLLGKYEDYLKDLKQMFEKLNLKLDEPPLVNSSTHLHYSHYYTLYGKELVEASFPEDVLKFGYRFNDQY